MSIFDDLRKRAAEAARAKLAETLAIPATVAAKKEAAALKLEKEAAEAKQRLADLNASRAASYKVSTDRIEAKKQEALKAEREAADARQRLAESNAAKLAADSNAAKERAANIVNSQRGIAPTIKGTDTEESNSKVKPFVPPSVITPPPLPVEKIPPPPAAYEVSKAQARAEAANLASIALKADLDAKSRAKVEAAESAAIANKIEAEIRANAKVEAANLAAVASAAEAQIKAQAKIEAAEAARVLAESEAKARSQAKLEAAEAARVLAESEARAKAQAKIEAAEAAAVVAKIEAEAKTQAKIEAAKLAAIAAAAEAQIKAQARIEATEAARVLAESEAKAKAQARLEAANLAASIAATEASIKSQAKVEAANLAAIALKAELEAKSQAKAEAASLAVIALKAELEAKAQAKLEAAEAARIVAKAELEAKSQAKAEAAESARIIAKAELEAKAQAKLEAAETARIQLKIESEAKAQAKAEAANLAAIALKADLEAKAQAKAEAAESARIVAKAELEAKSQAKLEATETARILSKAVAETKAADKQEAAEAARLAAKIVADEKAQAKVEAATLAAINHKASLDEKAAKKAEASRLKDNERLEKEGVFGRVGYNFDRFSQNLLSVNYHAGQFGHALMQGNWLFNSFNDGLQKAGGALADFAKDAFKEASSLEVKRVALAGTIEQSFLGRLNYKQSKELGDQTTQRLVGMAADSLGETRDYTAVGAGIFDSIAEVVSQLGGSAESMSAKFLQLAPDITKAVVLNSKVYGDGVPVNSIIRTFSKLLDTGKAPPREVFLAQNPGLRAALDRDKQKNGALDKATLPERAERLKIIFQSSISAEQLAELEGAVSTRYGATMSALFGQFDGLLGFTRKLASKTGKEVTIFSTLADMVNPFLSALEMGAKSLIAFSDPMVTFTAWMRSNLVPAAEYWSARLEQFIQQFSFSNENLSLGDRLSQAFTNTFGFDFSTIDFATPITAFFDGIANAISGFGADGQFSKNPQLNKAITALFDGIGKVFNALADRLVKQTIADPMGTLKVAAILNPTAVFSFGALLVSLIPALGVIGGFIFGSLIPALNVASMAIISLVGWPIALATGLLVGVVLFKDQLKSFGGWLQSLGSFTGQVLGQVFISLGHVGNNLSKAWDKLTKFDLIGVGVELVYAVGNAFLALVSAVASPFALLFDLFKFAVIDPLAGLISRVVPDSGGLTAGEMAPGSVGLGFKVFGAAKSILGFAEGNSLGNLVTGYAKERASAPAGAQVVFANSSEAIIPGNRVSAIANSTRSSNNISMTINNYGTEDIATKVRNALEEILN